MEIREILVLILGVIFFIAVVGLRSLKFGAASETMFELERRAKTKNELAQKILKRKQLLPDIFTFRYVLETLLIVFVVVCLSASLGWFLGILLSIVTLLGVGMLAHSKPIANFSQKLYQRFETPILDFITRLKPGLKFVRDAPNNRPADFSLHSKDELLHLVREAKIILTESERNLLEYALKFEEHIVREIMTPRSVIEAVEAREILGPVVLDRLHKSGHSQFPVIEKDVNHIIGLLYLNDLFSLARSAEKSTAKKLMEPKVYYINENQPLPSALTGFLRVRSSLFIVVNEFEETTGVITIEDVIEALIGRKMRDEFDQYDDLRAVASGAAAGRQKSGHSTHIK